MRKRVFGRKLGRNRATRKALFRSLVRALVLRGSVKTTLAKARAVQPEVERLVSMAKTDSLAQRRAVAARLGNDHLIAGELFGKLAKAAVVRRSGFTRIVKIVPRKGDGAQMARLEFVDKVGTQEKKVEEKKAEVAEAKIEKDKE